MLITSIQPLVNSMASKTTKKNWPTSPTEVASIGILPPNNEVTIWSRLLQPADRTLTPEAARSILELDFSPTDRNRMHELSVKNHDETLTAAERTELEEYLRVGYLLDLMQSKARLSLKKSAPSDRPHG